MIRSEGRAVLEGSGGYRGDWRSGRATGATLAGRAPKDRLREGFSKEWLRQFSILVSRKEGFRSIRENRPVILRLFFISAQTLDTGLLPLFSHRSWFDVFERTEIFSNNHRVFSQVVCLYDFKCKGRTYRSGDLYQQRNSGESMQNTRFSSKNPVSAAVSAGCDKKS